MLDVVTLEPTRMEHQAAEVCERDGADHEYGKRVLRKLVTAVHERRQKPLVRESGEDAGDQQLDRAGGEDDETPENRRVHEASDRLAQDLGLRDSHAKHIPDTLPRPIDAAFRLPEPHVLHEPLHVEREEARGDGENEQEDDVFGAQCPFFASRTAVVSAGTISRTSPTTP